ASTSSSQFQHQPLMLNVPGFPSRRTNTGTCFACGKPGHWRSCAIFSNFLCSDMIFEAESRNSDQECLDVASVSSDVTPLVLGAVKDSESTVDISIQPSVRGRLFKCIDFWRTLPASQFILNVISQGYKIPFFQLPTPFYKANNASARSNSSFVTIAVNELLSLNLIDDVFCAPDIINPLSV
ncbi:unnamed protein product, partial [Porites evermanni]